MSSPTMSPAPRVLTRKPEGGDHWPEGRRATTIPDPPAPEMCRPVRKVVKIARPAAERITEGGILTRAGDWDPPSCLEEDFEMVGVL